MIHDHTALVFGLWRRYYGRLWPSILDRQLKDDWRQAMKLIGLEISLIKDIKSASRQAQKLIYHQFLRPYGWRRPRSSGKFIVKEIPGNRKEVNCDL